MHCKTLGTYHYINTDTNGSNRASYRFDECEAYRAGLQLPNKVIDQALRIEATGTDFSKRRPLPLSYQY